VVTAERILLFGSGGHCKVVRDIVSQAGAYDIVAVIDKADEDHLARFDTSAGIVAIGDNWTRSRVVERILQQLPDFRFVTAIHRSAVIGTEVEVGPGTVIMAGSCINPGGRIGSHCIVNTGAILDHDSVLGDYASVAPGVVIGGMVSVGSFSTIGIGASIIHAISVGHHTVIGAGSVVVSDIPGGVVAYGSPCRVVRSREPEAPYL
jgi:sugar O-acyltransferase (sialic acid O-acetyltransferase NeuD family)